MVVWAEQLSTCQLLTFAQARVKAIAEVVGELVAGVKDGRDVDLNNVKREVRLETLACVTHLTCQLPYPFVSTGFAQILPSKSTQTCGHHCCCS